MKKIKISSEIFYLIAIVILAFSVAMITTTGFGVSMIVAPAYIVSEKASFLSFGQAEYVVQGILFIIMCIALKRFKFVYLTSFLCGVIYGGVLDLFRTIIPHFNPDINPAGTLPIVIRIIYFICGMVLTSFSIAMFFKSYLYPQVYDFFVKAVSERYDLNRPKFKTCFDVTFLVIGVTLTLVFFHKFVGIGVGTLIMTVINGTLIGFFSKLIDKIFIVEPKIKKLAQKFEIC